MISARLQEAEDCGSSEEAPRGLEGGHRVRESFLEKMMSETALKRLKGIGFGWKGME